MYVLHVVVGIYRYLKLLLLLLLLSAGGGVLGVRGAARRILRDSTCLIPHSPATVALVNIRYCSTEPLNI